MKTFESTYNQIRNKVILKRGLLFDGPIFSLLFLILHLILNGLENAKIGSLLILFITLSIGFGSLYYIFIFKLFYPKKKCKSIFNQLKRFENDLNIEDMVLISMFTIYSKSNSIKEVDTLKWEKFIKNTRVHSHISNDDLLKIVQSM